MKNSIFQSLKNRICPKGLTHAFGKKNALFFINLFSVNVRLEVKFNNVLHRKETFFGHEKFNLSKSQKSHFLCFWSKNTLFLVEIRLAIIFNNVLDRKETFFGRKKFNFSKPQKSHFSKGVNPSFNPKLHFVNLFLVEIRLEIMFNNVLDRKETFLAIKNSIF